MPTTELTIRRYRPADEARVLELHEEALRDANAYAEGVPDPDLDDVEAHYLAPGGEFLVGLVDGRIVAMGAFRPVEERTAEAFDGLRRPAAELKRMRVAPPHQRRGFGQQIYEELERRAHAEGFAELVLDVQAHQEDARQFYERNGFEVEREVEIEAFGETLETMFYRKPLEE